MIKKIPRSFWSSDIVLVEPDWRTLEQGGKVSLTKGQRQALHKAIQEYRTNADAQNAAVRPGQVREPLARLAQALGEAAKATNAIMRPGDASEAAVTRLRRASQTAVRSELRNLNKTLLKWQQIADGTLNELPLDDGRRENDPVGELLTDAIAVFAAAGGKGYYTKTAIAFFEGVLTLAGAPKVQKSTLIERVKKLREKAPQKSRT